jgi:hypothetical protein
MQARAVTEAWTNNRYYPSPKERENIAEYYEKVRKASLTSGWRAALPPAPFLDYVGLVEQAARELGLGRVDETWSSVEGPVVPARYVDIDAGEAERLEARKSVRSLQKAMRDVDVKNIYAVRAVFNGLLGRWVAAECSEETGEGTDPHEIVFQPRRPENPAIEAEYVVVEKTSQEEHRIFRYDEGNNQITVGYPHEKEAKFAMALQFMAQMEADERDIVRARLVHTDKGESLESSEVLYQFHFSGTWLREFSVEGVGEGDQRRTLWKKVILSPASVSTRIPWT